MRLRSQAKVQPREAVGPRFVNAFYDRDSIVLVHRVDDQVLYRRVRAESSCFIHSRDYTRKLKRMMQQSIMVRGVKPEGKWTRILWRDRDTAKRSCLALEKRGIETFEGAVNPIRRYCADNRVVIDLPRRVWLDIETDSRLPFSKAREGKARVLCWVLSKADGTTTEGLLNHETDEDEARLLRELWAELEAYDQVLAWNGDRFDFPVIELRSHAVGVRINVRRWLWLDHLDLFRRMNMMAAESGEEKQSFALQAIAMAVLKDGKDDFDAGRTWEAWSNPRRCRSGACMQCRRCLVRYCAKDTTLMPRIEEKTGYVDLLQSLCEATGTFPDTRGINPGAQVDNFLMRLSLEQDYRFPTKHDIIAPEKYKGAFVMDPTEKGIAKNVHVADFSAFYPTIIISWNMSPETKLDCPSTMCATAALTDISFDTVAKGMLPIAVEKLMEMRKKWNVEKSKHPPGTDAWKDADRRSTAYKIAANSFYGVIGAPFSRFFDREVAESITQCAAWLIQETIRAAELKGMRVVYGDTDSLFVMGATREEFGRFVAWCNSDLYPPLLKARGCKENRINLAYEKEFERVIFCTAKKYCGTYVHYKGKAATADSKPEVKGLEYKRGDASRFSRQFQEQVVNKLCIDRCEDPHEFEVLVDEWQDRILNQPIELDDVVIAKRLGKPLAGYKRRFKDDGNFRRDLPHIEMARLLEERGRDVGEGVKIGYVCVDGGVSPKLYIPAEDWTGDCDRHELWDKTTWPATMRLLEAAFPGHDWSTHKRTRPRKQRGKRKGALPLAEPPVRRTGRKLARKARGPELPWGQAPSTGSERPAGGSKGG